MTDDATRTGGGHRTDKSPGSARDVVARQGPRSSHFAYRVVMWVFLGLFALTALGAVVGALIDALG